METMKEAKHTPTPWNWDNDLNGETFIYKSIHPPYKNRLATMNSGEPIQYENAAFIIRAVNSHHEMAGLLRKMLAFSDARGVEKKRTLEESRLADEVSDFLAAEAEGR